MAPHRSGIADGLIAIWGKITLEQLDQESRAKAGAGICLTSTSRATARPCSPMPASWASEAALQFSY